jgi:hypothetical protein
MEIERKFLVKKLPDLSNIDPVRFERYYLNVSDNIEERIQNTNGRYTYEKKVAIDELSRQPKEKRLQKKSSRS